MLTDANPEARATAIEALARVGYLPALPTMARALDDESEDVHVAAVIALSRMEAEAVTRAIRADLPSTKRAMRGALDVMRANPAPAQRIFIDACISDDDPTIRRAAVAALAVQLDPSSIDDLAPMLDDPAPEVRREALHALARSRRPRVRDLLVDQLADDPSTRGDVACALGELGDPSATPALVRHFEGSPPLARLAIIDALANLGEASAEPLLVRLLGDSDTEVRRSAVLALGRAPSRTALRYLVSAAWDERWEVRAAFVEAVSGETGTAVKATLEQLCLDPHSIVASRARRRLEEIEDR
jgi:HEAT repeat protein